MLVLTRKPGESICIGSDVELVVLDVVRGRVKLGFAGPKNVPIRRGELEDASLKLPDPQHDGNERQGAAEQPSRPPAVPHLAPLRNFRVVAGPR